MQYRSELLADRHQLDPFYSSNVELDEWLIQHARHAAAMNTGRTFVWPASDAKWQFRAGFPPVRASASCRLG